MFQNQCLDNYMSHKTVVVAKTNDDFKNVTANVSDSPGSLLNLLKRSIILNIC